MDTTYSGRKGGTHYLPPVFPPGLGSLTRDLRLLESIGVVYTDSPAPLAQRRGRSPRYRVDAERVEALLADLRSQLVG